MSRLQLIPRSVTVEAGLSLPVGALLAAPLKSRPNNHAVRRRSLRLEGFDYSKEGAYFVTICTRNRECLLGDEMKGKMRLNELDRMVQTVWDGLPERFPTVELDAFVVMPNHVHGILLVGAALAPPKRRKVGAGLALPLGGAASSAPTGSASTTLGKVLRVFKSMSAIGVNRLLSRSGQPLWQRNYYEHVIRDEESLNRLREYIATNPLRWQLDRENPERKGEDEFDHWLATFKRRPPGGSGADPPADEIVATQLGLEMGIALPVQELRALVKSLSPEGSTQSENR